MERLSSWKGRYFSLGGRIVLIKVVLSSLLVYYFNVFKCPASVIEKLERIQRKFLWNDDREKRKFHLVNWTQVCKQVSEGGLGIRPLRQLNTALLGKRLWRY